MQKVTTIHQSTDTNPSGMSADSHTNYHVVLNADEFRTKFPERSITPPPSLKRNESYQLNSVDLKNYQETLQNRVDHISKVKKELESVYIEKSTINSAVLELENVLENLRSLNEIISSKEHTELNQVLLNFNACDKKGLQCIEEVYCYPVQDNPEHKVYYYQLPRNITTANGQVLGVNNTQDAMTISEDTGQDNASRATSKTKSSKNISSVIKLLHPLELSLLANAIKTLLSPSFVDTALVVDIFGRDNDSGILKISDDGFVETHAVVLRSQTLGDKKQILMIDPNSSAFSKHASSVICQLLISSTVGYWVNIVIPDKKMQIYSPPEQQQDNTKLVGSGEGQFRDCEDIAIKLCRLFNTIDKDTKITCIQGSTQPDIIYLSDTQAVQLITNNQETNKKLAGHEKKYPFRCKQSTDNRYANELEKIYHCFKKQKDYFKDNKDNNLMKKMSEKIASLDEYYQNNDFDSLRQELDNFLTNNVKDFIKPFIPTPTTEVIGDNTE